MWGWGSKGPQGPGAMVAMWGLVQWTGWVASSISVGVRVCQALMGKWAREGRSGWSGPKQGLGPEETAGGITHSKVPWEPNGCNRRGPRNQGQYMQMRFRNLHPLEHQ